MKTTEQQQVIEIAKRVAKYNGKCAIWQGCGYNVATGPVVVKRAMKHASANNLDEIVAMTGTMQEHAIAMVLAYRIMREDVQWA